MRLSEYPVWYLLPGDANIFVVWNNLSNCKISLTAGSLFCQASIDSKSWGGKGLWVRAVRLINWVALLLLEADQTAKRAPIVVVEVSVSIYFCINYKIALIFRQDPLLLEVSSASHRRCPTRSDYYGNYPEMLKPRATPVQVLVAFVSNFTGDLKERWIPLSQYWQTQVLWLLVIDQFMYNIYVKFLGGPIYIVDQV